MIRHKQPKIASNSRKTRASLVIGTAVGMVYNVFITDSWTAVDLRLEHDLGVKEVWERHVFNKMFRFQGLTLKTNIRGLCLLFFLVIFYQPFPQQEKKDCVFQVPVSLLQSSLKRSNLGTQLLAWTKSPRKEASQNSSFAFDTCSLWFFFLSGW